MAQIIAKFGYLKGKSRGGYAKYIATREGVEKLDESLRDRPVTQSQQEFIQKLLEDFPDSKELWEYEDYKKSPTLGSASEFVSAALELHMGELSGRSGYLKYIGTRPRVEKQGNHGLFSYAGEPLSLSRVAQEVDAHRGNLDSHLLPAPGGRPAAGLRYRRPLAGSASLPNHHPGGGAEDFPHPPQMVRSIPQ